MTDITQESLQKKQEAIDLVVKRYRGMEQRTEDIDLRLRLYFEDLLEHSSAKEDDDNDWHGIYEPRVTMHFTDPSRAVTITHIDPLYQGEEITMLLMPMLVNEE